MQQRVCAHSEQKLATPHTQDRYSQLRIQKIMILDAANW